MSCILVGNGTSLLDSPRGEMIDAHDTIVRFNQCDIARFTPYTGRRTQVYFTCNPYSSARMEKFDHLRQIWVHSWAAPERCGVWASYAGIPNAAKVPHDILVEMRAFGPAGYAWYSTGAVAAWLMLKDFPKIHMIGFDWWDREAHHYSDKAVRGNLHKPDKEREYFTKLEAEGKVTFL